MKEITGQETSDWFNKYKEQKKDEDRLKVIFELEKFRAQQEAKRWMK